MNLLLWVVTWVLCVGFFSAGALKMLRSKQQLAASGMDVVEDFAPATIKVIGVLELLAAIGLVLPGLIGVAPTLVPVAAAGLALLMTCAAVAHAARREYPMIVVTNLLLILAVFVAVGRLAISAL